jgi:cell division protein FtsZ
MNPLPSPLILIGVGGAGAAMTRGVLRAYGQGVRTLVLDTDAQTGAPSDVPFTLLGGNRLAGRGTGGEPSSARASFQDTPSLIDPALDGVRTAVVVTALGGGTGGGATGELLKRLHGLGITTLLFATLPFAFEGEERMRIAKTSAGPICQQADVSVLLPLDQLVADAGSDNMKEALSRGVDTLASGVTLLWRIIERPGFISLDAERLRAILTGCGRGQFATATAVGEDRVQKVLASLASTPLIKHDPSRPPVRRILVGILAGDDLRLSEVASISSGITAAFGPNATLELGTVNDEATFSGRLSVVMLLFEESATAALHPGAGRSMQAGGGNPLPTGTSRFHNAEKTLWGDEDLDVPTFIRRQLTLDR